MAIFVLNYLLVICTLSQTVQWAVSDDYWWTIISKRVNPQACTVIEISCYLLLAILIQYIFIALSVGARTKLRRQENIVDIIGGLVTPSCVLLFQ